MIKLSPCGSHILQVEDTLLKRAFWLAKDDPVMQLHHLQNFSGEKLSDVQKNILHCPLHNSEK